MNASNRCEGPGPGLLPALGFLFLLACGSGGHGDSPSEFGEFDGEEGGGNSTCMSYYACDAGAGATEVKITNNCGKTESVSLSIVAGKCAATVQPACIQNVDSTQSRSVWLLGQETANNFRVGAFGSSTLFEVTRNASGEDWYDISQNKGFDVGMTVVPPGGDVPYVVCTSQNCPGAYPLGDTECDADPCLQPNYSAGPTGGTFELYLCNGWKGDPRPAAARNTDTPGPLGCSYNQGACISPTDPACPSDAPGHDAKPEDLPCQWGHPVPGQTNPGHGTCPLRCPA